MPKRRDRQPAPAGGVDVIGVLPGTTPPDEQRVLGAHDDPVFGCVGADDDASGVAGVLEAARVHGRPRPGGAAARDRS